jgi:hypothetical protein
MYVCMHVCMYVCMYLDFENTALYYDLKDVFK